MPVVPGYWILILPYLVIVAICQTYGDRVALAAGVCLPLGFVLGRHSVAFWGQRHHRHR